MEKFSEFSKTTEAAITIGNETIQYKVIAEDTLFRNDQGQIEASMFSFSYLRTDVESPNSERPVVFIFGGGPGDGVISLDINFTGPRRIKIDDYLRPKNTPPYELVDNPDTLLDKCDLVFIDGVGSGYGRLLDKSVAAKYFSIDGDAIAFAQFIERWIIKHDRWNSPKYIMGDSYGTIRAAALCTALAGGAFHHDQIARSITINGAILISSGLHILESHSVEESALMLPSYAATEWYHHRQGKPDLEIFVEEARNFAATEYLSGLFLGNSLDQSSRERLAEKISYYSGVAASHLLKNNLRIKLTEYTKCFFHDCNKELGFYDTRFISENPNNTFEGDPYSDDGQLGQYCSLYVGIMNTAKKKELDLESDRAYIAIDFKNVNMQWDFSSKKKPIEYLSSIMRKNKEFKVFFSSGYYDLCTPFNLIKYFVDQHHLDRSRITFKEYETGHMPGIGEEPSRKFSEDLKRFIMDTF